MNEDKTPNKSDIVTNYSCISCGKHFSAQEVVDIALGKLARPRCRVYGYGHHCMIEPIETQRGRGK